jgi:hypothetical protein
MEGLCMASPGMVQNRSSIAALATLAMPFVNSFLCDQRANLAEARFAYIQAAKQQGYDKCSEEDYRKGFFLACYYTM